MRWGHVALVVAAITWILTCATHPVSAECARVMKPAESFHAADVVVIGTVQSIGDQLLYSNVQLKVQTYYKGQLGENIVVRSNSGSQNHSSTALDYKAGQKYLLYLTKLGSTWETNTCYGSHLLTNGLSQQEQSVLGKGYAPQGSGKTLSSGSTHLFSVVILAVALYGFYQFQKKRSAKPRIDPPDNQ